MAKTEEQRAAQRAYMKMWRAKNVEKRSAYLKEWKAKNAEHVQAYNIEHLRDYQHKPQAQKARRERNLRENYGMTPDEFNALWASQAGKCAICATPLMPKGRQPNSVCIDHNHQTGEVRGLLCRSCNDGIGRLKDSPDVLESAAKYLRNRGNYSATQARRT